METAVSPDKVCEMFVRSGIALFYVFDACSGGLVMMNDPGRLFSSQKLPSGEDPARAIMDLSHEDDRHVVEEWKKFLESKQDSFWMSYFRIPDAQGICRWYLFKGMVSRHEASGLPLWTAGLMVPLGRMGEFHPQLHKMVRENNLQGDPTRLDSLTRQEKKVAVLIARGYSYTRIAIQLHIQPVTVNTHRRNILRKLHLKNIAQIACVVYESGLMKNDETFPDD